MRVEEVDEVTKNIIICDYLIEQIQKGNEEIQNNIIRQNELLLNFENLKLQEA